MTYRGSKTLLMLMVLGGYLFSLLGLPGVSVLCYGQSGHIAVEAYGANCAASVDTNHDHQAACVAESCEPACVDILIQTEPASPRNLAGGTEGMLLAMMHTALPQLPLALTVALISPVRIAHDQILPSLNDTQLALRSVILLV